MNLTKQHFEALVDFKESEERVHRALASLKTPEQLLSFLLDYASWNGQFAGGVAKLTGLISGLDGFFLEPGFPRAVADRSNYVASFIFDAARDEYNDHINARVRDTHRCLAQAQIIATAKFFDLSYLLEDYRTADWLTLANHNVQHYYARPATVITSLEAAFGGIGYHLGSELLADREFSIIDQWLRSKHPALVQSLMRQTVKLAGGEHRCYAWIGIHSGDGGGVEAEHFEYAVAGAKAAFDFLSHDDLYDPMGQALNTGFIRFNQDHKTVFENLTRK